MVIDQRNAGASVTPTTNVYTLDRWAFYISQSSKFTTQQNAAAVTPPTGFTNYLGVTSSSTYSVVAGDYFLLSQAIEGYNVADLAWGTANAKTITLSFWVRSSLTGTFGGSIQNNTQLRSYPFTYTISVANTWELKSVTITGDTSGTWLTTNGNGLWLFIGLGNGTTYSGPAGAWSGNNYTGATGATSVVGTNGATFYITGVQLEQNTSATPFERRLFNQELANCQRYYFKITNNSPDFTSFGVGVVGTATVTDRCYTAFTVPMRSVPTFNYSGLRVYDGSAAAVVTSISGQYSNTTTGSYSLTASGGGLTVGRAGMIIEQNSSAGYIDFSAEL
jgi:hypothetical protein